MVLRRRRRAWRPQGDDAAHQPFPDAVPKHAMYAAPLVVDRCRALEPESAPAGEPGHDGSPLPDGWWRVTFVVRVRDATGRRCPEIALDVTLAGPDRRASGLGHTDLAGQARFRMDGPPGTYTLTVDTVAGNAIALDTASSVLTASVTT